MKNKLKSVRNSSPRASVSQVKTKPKTAVLLPPACDKRQRDDLIRGDLTLKLFADNGAGLVSINFDSVEFELLQNTAAALRITLADLMEFIVHRQLEAFYPNGSKLYYRVSDAIDEVSTNLEKAERDSNGTWAISCALVESVRCLRGPQDALVTVTNEVHKVECLATTLEQMTSSVRVATSDANAHWKGAACPALLEHPVSPVLARRAA